LLKTLFFLKWNVKIFSRLYFNYKFELKDKNLIDEKEDKSDEKEEEEGGVNKVAFDDDKQNDNVYETDESEEDDFEEPDAKLWPVFNFNKVKELFVVFSFFLTLYF
jgi:hypothetical protein